jgi:hypothetical protein
MTDQTYQQKEKVAGKKKKSAKRSWSDMIDSLFPAKKPLEEAAEKLKSEKKSDKKPASKKGMDYLREQIKKTKR